MDKDAAFVGSIPEIYERGLGPVIFTDMAAEMARRVAALSPGRVLETAAGTGILTRALRDALPAATHLTATDLNAPMLAVARSKFATAEQADFATADAMALPFEPSSFDAVVCQFGVMFFPDKDKAYREVLRVLAPGGRYLFNTWDGHANNPFGRISHEVVGSFFAEDPPQFQKIPFSYPFEAIKDALVATGFDDITVSVWRKQKLIPSVPLFARGLVFGSPLVEQIRSRGVEPELVFDAMVEALVKAFGHDNAEMPLQGLIYSARKPG